MQTIGRYEILSEIGRGAMGAVYKARDPQLDRVVAVKVILTSNLAPQDLKHFKDRFVREAQTAAKMAHPGIITIYDFAEDSSGQPYIVMEYIEGQTLEKLLMPPADSDEDTAEGLKLPSAKPRLLISRSIDIGIQLAEALDFAHKRNVIHRDIKPSNILITPDGSAKIADFGIAKVAGTSMTQTGMMMGTPAFMSPEQVSAVPIDSRSDIFSLGAVLYWMFTGEKPFPGDSLTAITFKVVFSQPLPAPYLNPALPGELDVVLSRCLAKKPEDRYATGKELADDLRAIKEGRPVKATPAPPAETTAMQPSPLPAVAAGLPPEQRAAQAAAAAGGATVHVGSSPAAAAEMASAAPAAIPAGAAVPAPAAAPADAAPAAAAPAPRTSRLLVNIGLAAAVILAVALYFALRPGAEAPAPPAAAPAASAPASAAGAPPAGPGPGATAPAPAAQPAARSEAPPPASPARKTSAGATPAGTAATKTRAAKPPAGGASAAATPAAPVIPKAVPRSLLLVECNHNFKTASLTISLGTGEVLYETILEEKQKRVRAAVALPAGERVLVVRVTSDQPKFDQKRESGGIFEADMARNLKIGFGRGSALTGNRNLSLELGPNYNPQQK